MKWYTKLICLIIGLIIVIKVWWAIFKDVSLAFMGFVVLLVILYYYLKFSIWCFKSPEAREEAREKARRRKERKKEMEEEGYSKEKGRIKAVKEEHAKEKSRAEMWSAIKKFHGK